MRDLGPESGAVAPSTKKLPTKVKLAWQFRTFGPHTRDFGLDVDVCGARGSGIRYYYGKGGNYDGSAGGPIDIELPDEFHRMSVDAQSDYLREYLLQSAHHTKHLVSFMDEWAGCNAHAEIDAREIGPVQTNPAWSERFMSRHKSVRKMPIKVVAPGSEN